MLRTVGNRSASTSSLRPSPSRSTTPSTSSITAAFGSTALPGSASGIELDVVELELRRARRAGASALPTTPRPGRGCRRAPARAGTTRPRRRRRCRPRADRRDMHAPPVANVGVSGGSSGRCDLADREAAAAGRGPHFGSSARVATWPRRCPASPRSRTCTATRRRTRPTRSAAACRRRRGRPCRTRRRACRRRRTRRSAARAALDDVADVGRVVGPLHARASPAARPPGRPPAPCGHISPTIDVAPRRRPTGSRAGPSPIGPGLGRPAPSGTTVGPHATSAQAQATRGSAPRSRPSQRTITRPISTRPIRAGMPVKRLARLTPWVACCL